jgi:hypothetical protein
MDPKLVETLAKVGRPLSLASLIVVVLYLLYKTILGLPVFERLSEGSTFHLLTGIVDRVFLLALVGLVLGVVSYLYSTYLNRANRPLRHGVELVDQRIDPSLTTNGERSGSGSSGNERSAGKRQKP